jgi:5'-nucleotidase
MKILLTNDDGIGSANLTDLGKRLSAEHEVWIVAPASERSACSHSLNMRGPVLFRELGPRTFTCEGSTVDCVFIALRGFIAEGVDMVISGINLGPNLGTDIIYSGTAAGAREGAIMGKPSVAASAYSRDPLGDFKCEIEFIAKNIDVLYGLWTADHFININFPADFNNKNGVEITFPSRRLYFDRLHTERKADGIISVRVDGDEPGAVRADGSDYDAVKNNKVSISPVLVHPDSADNTDVYRNAVFNSRGGCNR